MESEFDKDYLPGWCEFCNEQGVYFVDDTKSPYHVIHQKCGFEILSAWCPKCGMGFELTNQIGDRPSHWACLSCKTEYPLDKGVFDKPINLYIHEELPVDVRTRVLPRRMLGAPPIFNNLEKKLKRLFPDRAILTILGVVILIASIYTGMENFFFQDVLIAKGTIIDHYCGDVGCQSGTCSLIECEDIDSVIWFIDAAYSGRRFNDETNLDGNFVLGYRLIIWPGNINLGIRGPTSVDWWVYIFPFLIGLFYFFTGAKGFQVFKRNEEFSQRITAVLEKISIRKLNWISPFLGIGIIYIIYKIFIIYYASPLAGPLILCLFILDFTVWIFPGIIGVIKTDFVDEEIIIKEKGAIKWGLCVITYVNFPLLALFIIPLTTDPELLYRCAFIQNLC